MIFGMLLAKVRENTEIFNTGGHSMDFLKSLTKKNWIKTCILMLIFSFVLASGHAFAMGGSNQSEPDGEQYESQEEGQSYGQEEGQQNGEGQEGQQDPYGEGSDGQQNQDSYGEGQSEDGASYDQDAMEDNGEEESW
ncbi:MAG: hypothetical protein ACQESV_01860 [Thermodesulfobacteriota bacterium]